MSSGSTGCNVELSNADRRVLKHLHENGADYPALIASNTGLHIPLVERRCVVLDDAGLIEAVSGEVIYRLTELGQGYATGALDPAGD